MEPPGPEPPDQADTPASEPLEVFDGETDGAPGGRLPVEDHGAAERPAESPAESWVEGAEHPVGQRGCVGRVLAIALRAAGLLAALLALTVLYQIVTWPDVAALAKENPETTAFIERWEGRSGRHAERVWVPYARISPHLKRAVLVAEDIDFFSHSGFATEEIRSSLERAWAEKRPPRGASTITQQLAKNLWLSPSRNPLRKVKEAILTVQLERNVSKRRILELYLNVAELGPGIYGAEAASHHWFGTGAAALTERQAAELAASLPNPDDWHPGATSRRYQARVELVLRRMGRARFLWKEI